MIAIIIREFLMDLKNMFRGWKLVLHLALLGLVLVMSRTEGEASVGFMMMLYCIYGTALMKPKVNKLFYLLPTRKKDRTHYLLLKCAGIFLYNMLLYIAGVFIMTLLTDYRFSQEISVMVCYVIPVFVAYCSLTMGNNYNWGRSKDAAASKKYQNRYALSYFLAMLPMLNAYILNLSLFKRHLQGVWQIITTILVYLFALGCLLLQLSILKYTDISEENVRKVEKLFG